MNGRRMKAGLGGLLVTLALALPLFGFAASQPAISVTGARVITHADGSVQLLFDVSVSNVECFNGAYFSLLYDARYLTPSDYVTNEALSGNGDTMEDAFFRPHADLYFDDDSPFEQENLKPQLNVPLYAEYSMLYSAESRIAMCLTFRGVPDGYEQENNPGILTTLEVSEGSGGEDDEEELLFVADSVDSTLVLGTLSFQADPRYLAEMDKLHTGNVGGLISFRTNPNDTTIGYYLAQYDQIANRTTYRHATLAHGLIELQYQFSFPDVPVAVRLAEPDVTVTAYEAYVDGTENDIVRAMGKHSPMVIVTYFDGSERAALLPWGRVDTPDDGNQFEIYAGLSGAYDPTGGAYSLRQNYIDPDGAVFPVPVEGKLTVTPVTLLSVAADDMVKTYRVPATGVQTSVLFGITSPDLLDLPVYARLMTDVGTGASTPTIAIDGWTPMHDNATWPGAAGTGTTHTQMELLLADSAVSGTPHWPSAAEMNDGALTPADHIGTYSFFQSDSYGSRTAAGFTKARIQAAYPWLTVVQDVYNLPNARRVLVGDGALIETERYDVWADATVTDENGHPTMTLKVGRREQNGTNYETMPENALFRLRLPDGTDLGTVDMAPDWFDADAGEGQGWYQPERVIIDTFNHYGYQIAVNPGVTAGDGAGQYAAERERLRRHINLGGWFFVSINENTGTYQWTDYIPVYVAPRANVHTESKVYRMIGTNAGLITWPGWPGRSFVLPRGSYQPVNEAGLPLYLKPIPDGGGYEQTTEPEYDEGGTLHYNAPYLEHFGAATTYDGETGAEPGRLYTFAVEDGSPWPAGPAAGIYQYGPAPFVDGTVRYAGYGAVGNPDAGETVTVYRQETAAPAQDDANLVLRYYGGRGGVTRSGEDVTLVTFDTVQEGYSVRDEFVLTIENHGTTDVYDLRVDTQTFMGGNGVFEVIKAPASFLPAGGSTTFTLTYTYDLRGNGNAARDYLETLYITSASRPTAAVGDPSSYWIAFDANFRVSPNRLLKVLVNTAPPGMGEAYVILGEMDGAGGERWLNPEPGSNTFEAGETVYILVNPFDEYSIDLENSRITDSSGASAGLPVGVVLEDGGVVYSFLMPSYDVTVNIVFYESNYSKLRLGDLRVYSGQTDDNWSGEQQVPPAPGSTTNNSVWQKSYTESERGDAEVWKNQHSANEYEEYLMVVGRADRRGFYSSAAHYLTVLQNDQTRAQVEVDLRQLVITAGGNVPISPFVQMYLLTAPPVSGTASAGLEIFNGAATPGTTDPTKPVSTFKSSVFDAPAPGKSVYVRIEVSNSESGGDPADNLRIYYLEIHRAPDETVAQLNYGNTPAGMIYNDAVMNAAQKSAALAAFKAANYSFANMDADLVPAKVKDDRSVWAARYWTEAWTPMGSVYEPESFLGTPPEDADNLDLDRYVFVALLGQTMRDPGLLSAQDSSGRNLTAAALAQVRCAVTVTLLNTEPGASQVARFAGTPDLLVPDTLARMTLDLGRAGATSSAWTAADNPPVRPGEYELVYTFLDYDGETPVEVTRKLLILGQPGDVNADGLVNAADVACLHNRVSHPLGFTDLDFTFGNVYRYRSGDANNDRNINNIDANEIQAADTGKAPVVFYPTTDYK